MLTWRPDDPAVQCLAPADRELLTTTGVPVGTFGYLDVPAEPATTADGVVLADDSGTPLVCTPRGVVAVEADGERFVNASAAQLVASMQRMARYVAEVRDVEDEDDALAVVHAALADLRALDAAAWADERHYWPVVGEQMVAGML